MASLVMHATALLLVCISLASHARRVKMDLAQERRSSNDKDEELHRLADTDAASGSLLEAEQSRLQEKLWSPAPLRRLALLLLVLEPAAAFHLPGASRSFAAMLNRDLDEGAGLQSRSNGQVAMQDEGANYPAAVVETGDTWRVQDSVPDPSIVPIDEGLQSELDRTLFSLDIEPRERLELLQSILSEPSVLKDVQEALSIVKDQGFMVGQSEALEKLFPPGTQSRADLEGLTALRKQVPEAFEELQEQVREQRSKMFAKMQKQMREASRKKMPSDIPVLGNGEGSDATSVLGWM